MDIVERLREQADSWLSFGWDNDDIFDDAANEIERLREQAHYHYEHGLKKDVEIERLREALQQIADEGSGWGQSVAWAALKEGE